MRQEIFDFRDRTYAVQRPDSGGSQPRIKEGASHHARRGKNAETFLIDKTAQILQAGVLVTLYGDCEIE